MPDLRLNIEEKKKKIVSSIKHSNFLKKIISKPEVPSTEEEIVYRKDGTRIEKTILRNTENNDIIKITYYDYFNDKKIKSVEEYCDGIKTKETNYSLFKSVTEYDISSGKKLKTTNYNPQNPEITASVYEYDIKSGKIVKMSIYRNDGKSIAMVKEISPETGLITRCINYKINTSAIASVAKYDFLGNTTVKTTYYYNTPINLSSIECINKKLISDEINKRVIYNPPNKNIAKLIDNLYKNKMGFSLINNS